jgi:hypothetical protein
MNRLLVAAGLLVAVPSLAAAAPTERRLHSEQIDSSSFLWNDWNKFQENYHPNYVADDDPKTAWTEGSDSSGAGEWLRIHVTALPATSKVRLKIRNGYQKSPALFVANARAKAVTVKLLPSGVTKQAVLVDKEGWQDVSFEQPAGPFEAIELKADSVYEGKKYTDLCISDVQVFATSTTRENPSFEKGKRERLLAWKRQRVDAARTFGKGTAGLPLLPAYRIDTAEIEPKDPGCEGDGYWHCVTRAAVEVAAADKEFARRWGAYLPIARNAAAAAPKGLVPAKLAPSDKRPIPAVDGVAVLDLDKFTDFGGDGGYGPFELPVLGVLGALRADTLRPLEIKSAVTIDEALAAKAPGCTSKKQAFHAWIQRGKARADGPDLLRAAVVVNCGKVEVREGWDDFGQMQILVYADNGDLAMVVGHGYAIGYEWKDQPDGGRALVDGLRLAVHGRRDTLGPVPFAIGRAIEVKP